MEYSGNIQKLVALLEQPVQYQLPIRNDMVAMNALIGRQIILTHSGEISCIVCGVDVI